MFDKGCLVEIVANDLEIQSTYRNLVNQSMIGRVGVIKTQVLADEEGRNMYLVSLYPEDSDFDNDCGREVYFFMENEMELCSDPELILRHKGNYTQLELINIITSSYDEIPLLPPSPLMVIERPITFDFYDPGMYMIRDSEFIRQPAVGRSIRFCDISSPEFYITWHSHGHQN